MAEEYNVKVNDDGTKTFTVEVQQDGEDMLLPLPEELLKQVGWKEGDTLIWTDNGDGTFSLTKESPGDDPLGDVVYGDGC